MADYETLHVLYVGYHDANNVSNFGGAPIKFKKHFIVLFTLFTDRALHSRGGCYATMRRLQQYGRPYQPKHGPSFIVILSQVSVKSFITVKLQILGIHTIAHDNHTSE